ncbi:MAG: hypothetical protein ACRDTO_00130 [Mycobacterium sp.]
MNISEANALNTVLRWVIGAPTVTGGPVPDDVACDQAVWLADRANRVLSAGLTGERVGALWPVLDSLAAAAGARR